jgi:hypothetical protein
MTKVGMQDADKALRQQLHLDLLNESLQYHNRQNGCDSSLYDQSMLAGYTRPSDSSCTSSPAQCEPAGQK